MFDGSLSPSRKDFRQYQVRDDWYSQTCQNFGEILVKWTVIRTALLDGIHAVDRSDFRRSSDHPQV